MVLSKEVVEPPLLPLATPALPPVHKPLMLFGLAMRRPSGSVSVKATPVSVVVVLGLFTVKVRVVVPPTGIVAARNVFVATGGEPTKIVALAELPGPLSVEVMAPWC